MSEKDLKPCPFCQCKMTEFEGGNFGHPREFSGIESNCIIRGQLFHVMEREIWNQRRILLPEKKEHTLDCWITQTGSDLEEVCTCVAKEWNACRDKMIELNREAGE